MGVDSPVAASGGLDDERLSAELGWPAHYEPVIQNPYLDPFYKDMPRWSFHLQIYFLNSRLKQLLEIQQSEHAVIQDRTIYEDAHIFAPNLHEMGLMSSRDFENYAQFFRTIKSMVKPPDLMIYLKASIPTLVDQIQKRGRLYEDNIRLDYLKRLNEHYNHWVDNYKDGKLLIIDIDNCNYADNPDDFAQVISKIDAEINGLF